MQYPPLPHPVHRRFGRFAIVAAARRFGRKEGSFSILSFRFPSGAVRSVRRIAPFFIGFRVLWIRDSRAKKHTSTRHERKLSFGSPIRIAFSISLPDKESRGEAATSPSAPYEAFHPTSPTRAPCPLRLRTLSRNPILEGLSRQAARDTARGRSPQP